MQPATVYFFCTTLYIIVALPIPWNFLIIERISVAYDCRLATTQAFYLSLSEVHLEANTEVETAITVEPAVLGTGIPHE